MSDIYIFLGTRNESGDLVLTFVVWLALILSDAEELFDKDKDKIPPI